MKDHHNCDKCMTPFNTPSENKNLSLRIARVYKEGEYVITDWKCPKCHKEFVDVI